MIPVILSGGSGTRLWPVSRQQMPKQFCDLFGKPLQTLTLERALRLGKPWIITSETLRTLTELNLKDLSRSDVPVLYEPVGRNTAPAIALLCRVMEQKKLQNETVAVFPSDHLIRDEATFLKSMHFAEKLASAGQVVLLGIKPTYPETGYGYIQTLSDPAHAEGNLQAYAVHRFHEKPSLEKAQEFLRQGHFVWNAGIFVFRVATMIELMKVHQPELWKIMTELREDLGNLADVYARVKSISLDYAIMEKLDERQLSCIPGDFGWSDVGSWDAVAQLGRSRERVEADAKGNFVFGEAKKTYAFLGLEDVILVDTDDAILVAQKGSSQNVRKIVEQLEKKQPTRLKDHVYEYRPWGNYEILREEDHFKSKVIEVNPRSQISYQSHAHREEHWIITKGQGEVVLNDEILPVQAGTHVHIPVGAKHRIRNTTDSVLEFVEVQLGTSFEESDIVRYQDDYKRA